MDNDVIEMEVSIFIDGRKWDHFPQWEHVGIFIVSDWSSFELSLVNSEMKSSLVDFNVRFDVGSGWDNEETMIPLVSLCSVLPRFLQLN